MAKDPAFLFYPGDYLKDTQCLSEKSQVAYDRIMCEHMRNICITQQQLNFFTKRLSDEEKKEILFVLKKIEGGYQIEWVADSICKRKDYSKSRAENRKGKTKNISTTYDSHMENANENEIKDESVEVIGKKFLAEEVFELPAKNLDAVKQLISISKRIDLTDNEVIDLWAVFKIQNLTGKKHYNSLEDIYSYFFNWLQTKKINGHKTITTSDKHRGTGQLTTIVKQNYDAGRKEDS